MRRRSRRKTLAKLFPSRVARPGPEPRSLYLGSAVRGHASEPAAV